MYPTITIFIEDTEGNDEIIEIDGYDENVLHEEYDIDCSDILAGFCTFFSSLWKKE